MSRRVMSLYQVTSCYVMSCDVTSCHVTSRHVTSCHIMPPHDKSHHVTSCHSCHVMPRHVMSRHVTSCHAVTSRHVTSCHVLSRHATLCHVIPHHFMSRRCRGFLQGTSTYSSTSVLLPGLLPWFVFSKVIIQTGEDIFHLIFNIFIFQKVTYNSIGYSVQDL